VNAGPTTNSPYEKAMTVPKNKRRTICVNYAPGQENIESLGANAAERREMLVNILYTV
jgi:hypothetical protein